MVACSGWTVRSESYTAMLFHHREAPKTPPSDDLSGSNPSAISVALAGDGQLHLVADGNPG
jgi:hypothetical protein